MVRLTETQRQIKEQLDAKYTLSAGWFNVDESVVHTTDPFGALTRSCYVGFYPGETGAVGSWGSSSRVTALRYNDGTTEVSTASWSGVAQLIGATDYWVLVAPREGVFWAHGTTMITRQMYRTDKTWFLTTEYCNFVKMIDAIAGLSVPEAVEGEVAFLNGANGEWTNKDDVRKGRKQKRQARSQPRRARPKRPRGTIALSHCAQRYARAIADPFNPACVGACVPVYPAPPSYKVTAHQRILTVTVGSGGVGAFKFNPSPWNNVACAAATTASFDGTTLEDVVQNAEWVTTPFSTLPFSNQTAGVQARVVSASAKVTYTGTALDLSGMFVSAVDPDHEKLANTLDLTSMSTLPYARVENTKRRMNNLSPMFGIKPHETDYLTAMYPLSTYTGSTWLDGLNQAPCGFLVSGVPGTTFNVELIIHVEYVGRPAVTGLTKSHTDSRGFEMVQQAGAQLASHLASTAQAAWPTMRRLLVEAGRDILSTQLGVRLPAIEL